eukprot:TRINITY_DN62430_c0_g1_i1.p1 TRINITY_DN62430_c0_g1~~TRINITY_DN62430_c0_g1_i1.p1  ORF type:complete len:378 (-),score=59.39 TRINITY_DN62430_c0_g1_i1:32-1165(-)
MGGPCILLDDDGRNDGEVLDSTDTFFVRPFHFDSLRWLCVEQCVEALKFEEKEKQEEIRMLRKERDESDAEFGVRVFSAGRDRAPHRPDWEAVRVEIMYRASRAKFSQHQDLQAQLLATGKRTIGHLDVGFWGQWNGLVHMRLREELRPPAERDMEFLCKLLGKFRAQLSSGGGPVHRIPRLEPFPGEEACPATPPSRHRGTSPTPRSAAKSPSASRSGSRPVATRRGLSPTRQLVGPPATKGEGSHLGCESQTLSVSRGRSPPRSLSGSRSQTTSSPARGAEVAVKIATVFRRFDANGDGVIGSDELSWLLRRLDPEGWTEARARRLVCAADQNRDGRIQYDEFVSWLMSDEQDDWVGVRKSLLRRDGPPTLMVAP